MLASRFPIEHRPATGLLEDLDATTNPQKKKRFVRLQLGGQHASLFNTQLHSSDDVVQSDFDFESPDDNPIDKKKAKAK